MHRIAIGEPYDASVSDWPEGCHYNYDVSGHSLHYLYNGPLPIEISSVQRGQAQFGLYVRGPVTFLLHQFGEMPWNDAPYSWWLVPEDERKLPEVSDDLHALLRVIMLDTCTGLVVALRVLTFSPEFTKRLHQAIRLQSERSFSRSRHDQIVRDVYSRFTTDDLVLRSEIFCKGGD